VTEPLTRKAIGVVGQNVVIDCGTHDEALAFCDRLATLDAARSLTWAEVAVAMHGARVTGCTFTSSGQVCSPADHAADAKAFLAALHAEAQS